MFLLASFVLILLLTLLYRRSKRRKTVDRDHRFRFTATLIAGLCIPMILVIVSVLTIGDWFTVYSWTEPSNSARATGMLLVIPLDVISFGLFIDLFRIAKQKETTAKSDEEIDKAYNFSIILGFLGVITTILLLVLTFYIATNT